MENRTFVAKNGLTINRRCCNCALLFSEEVDDDRSRYHCIPNGKSIKKPLEFHCGWHASHDELVELLKKHVREIP